MRNLIETCIRLADLWEANIAKIEAFGKEQLIWDLHMYHGFCFFQSHNKIKTDVMLDESPEFALLVSELAEPTSYEVWFCETVGARRNPEFQYKVDLLKLRLSMMRQLIEKLKSAQL